MRRRDYDPLPQPDPVFSVWSAHTSVNEMGTDGDLLGWFSTSKGATVAATDKGWWGGMGNVREHGAIKVDGKIYILHSKKPIEKLDSSHADKEKAIASARAKLTVAEREALGIK